MSRFKLSLALVLAVVAAGSFSNVATAGFQPPAFAGFCARFPAECVRRGPVVAKIELTAARMSQMRAINSEVNRTIRQVEDRGDVWSLPVSGRGDCEDLALLKRKKLIAAGWPSSVLLMTVARDREGYGHAVLTVATTKGNYILDNRTSAIRTAPATGYRYYSRQSASNPRVWVDINRDGSLGPTSSIRPEAKIETVALVSDVWADVTSASIEARRVWLAGWLAARAD